MVRTIIERLHLVAGLRLYTLNKIQALRIPGMIEWASPFDFSLTLSLSILIGLISLTILFLFRYLQSRFFLSSVIAYFLIYFHAMWQILIAT